MALKKIIAALFVALLLPTACFAFSQTYQFVGTCDGGDMVYKWSIDGRAGAGGGAGSPVLTSTPTNQPFPNWPTPGQPGSSFMYPWTPYDILIFKVDILVISGIPPAFFMSGNDYDGDAMAWVPGNSNFGTSGELSPGHEFKFPGYATGHATNTSYLDLHGGCTAGQVANVMYTIFYIRDPASP